MRAEAVCESDVVSLFIAPVIRQPLAARVASWILMPDDVFRSWFDMTYRKLYSRLTALFFASLLIVSCFHITRAQTSNAPLTSQELVRLVYQLPSHPEKRDEVVEEIRKRGLGFPLTDGLRSVVASKSGND